MAGYNLRATPIDPNNPDLYAHRLDYEPLGAAGAGIFIATYHAAPPTIQVAQNPQPSQRYTLVRSCALWNERLNYQR